jgi:hypothetical protein
MHWKMKIAFCSLLLWPYGSFSQSYFPLNVGNWWNFNESSGYVDCEGIVYVPLEVKKDTFIADKKYADFGGFTLLGDRFIRQELNRVFSFDGVEGHEYLLFDFSANVGDTISVRDFGTKVIIMSAPMTFTQHDTTQHPPYDKIRWVLRDSVGLVSRSFGYCNAVLTRANIDGNIVTPTSVDAMVAAKPPVTLVLEQNYPNPFNPVTSIRFFLPMEQKVKLEIFNPSGQRVATLIDHNVTSGWHAVEWDASTHASGVYLYRLQSQDVVITRASTLVK